MVNSGNNKGVGTDIQPSLVCQKKQEKKAQKLKLKKKIACQSLTSSESESESEDEPQVKSLVILNST